MRALPRRICLELIDGADNCMPKQILDVPGAADRPVAHTRKSSVNS